MFIMLLTFNSVALKHLLSEQIKCLFRKDSSRSGDNVSGLGKDDRSNLMF
jgi:hypothetical protein